MKTTILRVMMLFAISALCVFIASAMISCRSVKYVTVPEVHTEYKHLVDTIIKNDSVIVNDQVVVREVDSAALAAYGIKLANKEKAWLIERNNMQRTINQLRETKLDSVYVHDSIPVPVPEIKEVPADLTWWQTLRLHIANIVLYLLGILAIIFGYKLYKRKNIV